MQYSFAQVLPVPKTFAWSFYGRYLESTRTEVCMFSSFYGILTPIKVVENVVIKELLDIEIDERYPLDATIYLLL